MANGEAYAEQFGWSAEFEALVARIIADFAVAIVTSGLAGAPA